MVMSKISDISDEQLIQYYIESSSERDFARKCGYKSRIRVNVNSAQYLRFNRLGIVFPKINVSMHERHKSRRCSICNIPIWDSNKSGLCKGCKKQINDKNKIDYWLKTGNTQCSVQTTLRNCIRQYILDSQSGKCAICGLAQKWNGKHLNFILDHIDGDASNNDRDNLRLICPNCDSQLDTYKSKNKCSARKNRR